jgi:hypothetical protein
VDSSSLSAEGTGPTYKALSYLVDVIVGGTSRGKGSFPGHSYPVESLSYSIPIYGILHMVHGFYQAVHIPWQRHDII